MHGPHRAREGASRGTRLLVVGVTAVVLASLFVVPAFASHPEVSLPGSNFEIDTDANLRVDDPAPSIDWANVNEQRRADSPSGSNDESFGQGAKEDTPEPTVVDGSIPPNKSDLKFFGVYQEGTTTAGFLNLFWSRVQDPSGTTNMDFEFNFRQCTPGTTRRPRLLGQRDHAAPNGRRPADHLRPLAGRDASDALDPDWTGSVWGPATDLTTSGNATGSINTRAIPASESDGLGAQSARTFGEAQISLSALFGGATTCRSFGSAYLKSRSSDSFTAALKDFVPPAAVNISNCGSVKIIKTDDAGARLAGAEFTLYKDNAPVGGTVGARTRSRR